MKFIVTHFDGLTSEVEVRSPNDLLENIFNKTLNFSVACEDGTKQNFTTPFILAREVIDMIQGLIQSKIVVYKSFNPWGKEAELLFEIINTPGSSRKITSNISKLIQLNLLSAQIDGKYCYNIRITAAGLEAVQYFKKVIALKNIDFNTINSVFAWYIWQSKNSVPNRDIKKAINYDLIYFQNKNQIETNQISYKLYMLIQPQSTAFFVEFWTHWKFLLEPEKKYFDSFAQQRLREVISNILSMVPENDWAIIISQPASQYFQKIVDLLFERQSHNKRQC